MMSENERLDDAMRRGDELLRDSLRGDERKRSRIKVRLIAAVLLVACALIAVWKMPSPFHKRPSQPLSAQLLTLTDDWRHAFTVGENFAAADPDAALATLNANWSRIPTFEARQQILKAFAFSTHPRMLDVMHLGMTDSAPQVQAWACEYLRQYAFQDFAENRSAYDAWRKDTEGKPLAQVSASAARAWVERIKKPTAGPDLERIAKETRDAKFGLRNISAARDAAVNAGARDVAVRWIRVFPQHKQDVLQEAVALLDALNPDETYLRANILPLLADGNDRHVRSAAAHVLGRKDNGFAVEPLMALLRESVTSKDNGNLTWEAAQALGEIGDLRAIPTMIAVIDADNTYDTVYGVGYFGLSKMTGVQYHESHDGKWWRDWWQRERTRFPEPVRSATIPVIDKKSSAASTGRPIFAMVLADEPPVEDLRVGEDEKMRFFLIGPMSKEKPKDGYHLLLVLPGGDGSAEFRPFVTNILPNALPENYIIAQLVAPGGNENLVWPTDKSRDPKHKGFATEKFIDAVVEEVKKKHPIDAKHIYALGWSSGGPPVYFAAMREKTPLTGAFVAMSVFKPAELPPAKKLNGRAFYILHSPQDFIKMTFPQNAAKQLKVAGAKTELQTYEGGHGWQGDPFAMIRAGIDWLEQQKQN